MIMSILCLLAALNFISWVRVCVCVCIYAWLCILSFNVCATNKLMIYHQNTQLFKLLSTHHYRLDGNERQQILQAVFINIQLIPCTFVNMNSYKCAYTCCMTKRRIQIDHMYTACFQFDSSALAHLLLFIFFHSIFFSSSIWSSSLLYVHIEIVCKNGRISFEWLHSYTQIFIK